MQFLVNETMKIILYICRTMTNLKLRLLKLFYFHAIYKLFQYISVNNVTTYMQYTQKVFLCLRISLRAEQVFIPCPVNYMRLQEPLHCIEPCLPPTFVHLVGNSEIYNLLMWTCIVIGVDILPL